MLRCPNDPNHDTFVMAAMVPETWILNKDGDCEDAFEDERGCIETDLSTARCQDCDAPVEVEGVKCKSVT
jgi:hypothetical protein